MQKPILLFFLLSFCCSNPLAGQISFSAPVTIDTFHYLVIIEHCYVDLDQDGDEDFVYIEQDSQRIVWYEQDKYHFLNERSVLIKDVLADVIVPVDLDQDGYTDLILRNWNTQKWHWYKNLGNAQFDVEHAITDTSTNYIKIIDFDHDGDQDIIYTVPTNQLWVSRLVWAANDGNNLFGAPQNILPDSTLILGVSFEDLNDDGFLDLEYSKPVTSSFQSAEIWIALNDGNNNYLDPKLLITGSFVQLLFTDIDHDNIPDILLQKIIANEFGSFCWLKNDGAGNFGACTEIPVSKTYESFKMGDFENDGDMDIIALPVKQGIIDNIDVLLNNDSGVFDTLRSFPAGSLSYNYGRGFDVADWDQNGTLDVRLSASRNVTVWLNDGHTLGLQKTVISEGAKGMNSLNAVDLDKDGNIDLVTGHGETTGWYRNNGDNTFGTRALLLTDSTNAQVLQKDLDADGDLDLIRISVFGIFWYPNDGTGHFNVKKTLLTNTYFFDTNFQDINGDGDLDFMYAYYSGSQFRLKMNQNNGDGSFFVSQEFIMSSPPSSSIFMSDIDGDDYLDVCFVTSGFDNLIWFRNNGSGQFGDEQSVSLPSSISQPNFTDLDSDGDIDVFSIKDDYPLTFQYSLNDGLGNFGAIITQEFNLEGDLKTSPHFADLDSDSDQDIVLCKSEGIFIFENTGTGFFENPIQIPFPLSDYINIDLTDINADGKKDLLLMSGYIANVYWFENQSIVSTSESPNFTGSIQISPNPAASETTITIQTEAPQNQYLIELSDARGRLVKSLRSDATTIRLTRGQLPAGFYGVRVREAQNGRLIGVGALVWR